MKAYKENETYEEMLNRLKKREKGLIKNDVPSIIYFIVVDGKVVGTIDLRQKLNKSYYERLGHIAYYISPNERGKGYATKALNLAINKYKKTNIKRLLITCFEDNQASKKVIENNNGYLTEKYYDNINKKNILKYTIDLK